MALRKILTDGDTALHKMCRPVTSFDARLHTLLDDLKETLADANGAGLAAPQVGILRRVVIVVDAEDNMLELVNPEIVSQEGEQEGFEWGGRWKSFPDRPHLQWSDGGKYTSSMIRAGDYPPAMPPYREEDTDMTKEEIQAMIDAAVTAARPPVYTSVENCPAWARETVQKAVDEGVLRGDQGGGLRLTDDNLVNLQMLRNLGLLDGGGA